MRKLKDPTFIILTLVTIGTLLVLYMQLGTLSGVIPKADETLSPTPTPTAQFFQRVKKVEKFLAKYQSPLYPYARLIVKEAEEQNIDYRYIPAIAFNESTLCKHIPEKSYNCWGWGIYGDTVTRFDNFAHGIKTVTAGLRKNYYDKGRSTPEDIMKLYTPSSPNGAWAKKVRSLMGQIERM